MRSTAACCVGVTLALLLAELRARRRHATQALREATETRERVLVLALAERTSELERVSTVLDILSKAQHTLEVCTLPPLPAGFVPTSGYERCMAALRAGEDGYAQWAVKRHKCTLVSNFVAESPQKFRVDCALGIHVARCFGPQLDAVLTADPKLILLLLDAPNCGTTRALLSSTPELARHATRICIPQADPSHYVLQIRGAANNDVTAVQHHLLNIRCQRLDQWLASNRSAGLRVCVFFADFETSIYGKPKASFSPLRDLQLFFRLGYAHTHCLLGVTLSFRAPHGSRYAADAPQLEVDDLAGFVASEAAAVGLCSKLVETIRYGLTFCLFELTARENCSSR
ncbi:hypothetical protein T492DRAFT_1122512 [Pavlovales sp. CCMP2436]|nr:hypothetical protein T492DRAFT_1122512 [Pavlovales sp. CCMP2436]